MHLLRYAAFLASAMSMRSPSTVDCGVFTGTSGIVIVFGLTTAAFICYVGSYLARRYYFKTAHGVPLESRNVIVFAMDLSKLALGQGSAWLINLLNTHRNTAFSATNGVNAGRFDPLSWYFPTFLADELFAVPLGVVLGRILCWIARHLRNAHGMLWCTFSLDDV